MVARSLWRKVRNQFWHRLPYAAVLGWRLNDYEFAPLLIFCLWSKGSESWGHVIYPYDKGWLIPRRLVWPRRIALRSL